MGRPRQFPNRESPKSLTAVHRGPPAAIEARPLLDVVERLISDLSYLVAHRRREHELLKNCRCDPSDRCYANRAAASITGGGSDEEYPCGLIA